MSSIPTPPFRLVRALTSNGTKIVGSIAVFLAGSLLANFIALIAAGAALYQAHTAKEALDDQRDSFRLEQATQHCLDYLNNSRDLRRAFGQYVGSLSSQLSEGIELEDLDSSSETHEFLTEELFEHINSQDNLKFFADESVLDALSPLFEAELSAYLLWGPIEDIYKDPHDIVEVRLPKARDDWAKAQAGLTEVCRSNVFN
ncbi:hypothetical protein [Tateyamaria sp. syn59]|uniref:hypothetical protein n=1 Tax=Tateyamaria sp. syn59 TaxID=2576942 RepID=UPI0011BDBA98|nr:hypothetical protein [Tateyamaria sp. syn59]